MAKICYIAKKFNETHAGLIDTVNGIITDYASQGYDLTLRQVAVAN